uniref:SHH signaling and ciliogenesis regulator sdccag8 n=1 Tax=Nothobranchius furzeri TaxID=105023 RepID=A0A8C6NIE9_NOTFU
MKVKHLFLFFFFSVALILFCKQMEGRSSVPVLQSLVPMIHGQSDYIQHLEAEVKFCKEELQVVKQRIRVVVVENEKLQSELKSRAMDYTIHNSAVICDQMAVMFLCVPFLSHYKVLTVLFSPSAPELLKKVLNLAPSLSCIQVLFYECSGWRQITFQVYRLSLCSTFSNFSIQEMVNLCLLGCTQVEVQCEQLRREVVRQREQLEREAQALKARLTEAREKGRGEGRKQKEELVQTVSNLSQRIAELEGHLDRGHRERGSLTTQLEDTLNKLTSQEQQNAKVCMELRFQLSQAKLKKEEAERDLGEINAKASRQMEKAAQEVERLNSELVGCRRHLEAVQKDGSQSQAEALSLAEQLANAQRQLHLTRQDRDNAARAHVEEMSSVTASTQEREKNLCMMLQKTEAELLQREADSIMSSQNSLIRKLKEECSKLVVKMEDLSQNSRSELQQLALEKQHLEETVKSLRTRCSDLEEQCVQHGRVHQRMKDRLQQLDRHCQSSAQQVCELLAKQNQLMQERNTLCEELQSLRVTVHTHTHTHTHTRTRVCVCVCV